jgi:hypothetical protein
MDLQKISLKILTDAPVTLNLDPFLAIFGRWRAEGWVDLADYAHMVRGPGIVLIGHHANFSFDMGSAAPGILYLSKKGLEGAPDERVRQVFAACFDMTRCLIAEPEFPSGVHLRTGALELVFNDRLETPNTPETDRALRPAIESVLDRLYGTGAWRLIPVRDPSMRYGVTVEATAEPEPEVLSRRTAG